MESNNKKNKNSTSRTRRNNKRAQAYRNNKSKPKNNNTLKSPTTSSTTIKNKPEQKEVNAKVKETQNKIKEVEKQNNSLNIDKVKEKEQSKAQQEKIIEQEQKFKEEQKKRIEELLKQQQNKKPKVKEESKKTITESKIKPVQSEKKSEPIRPERIERNQSSVSKESPKIEKIPLKNKKEQEQTTSLSIDDFVPKNSSKDIVHSNLNTIEELEKINNPSSNPYEEKLSSIGKAEEKDLIEKLDKIKELELTSKINKLTKEAIASLDEKKAEEQPVNQTKEETEEPQTSEETIENKEKSSSKKSKNTTKSKKSKSSKGNIILILLLILSLGVFTYAVINIVLWQKDNNNTKDLTNHIEELVDVVEVPDSETVEIIEPQEEIPESNPYWDYIKVPLINVDFAELNKINSETAGWIQVMGTNINYPFVQTRNNSYYLSHSFDKSNNSAGWVFMDYRNNVQEFNRNNIIYAHGRLDTTMFGSLKNILTSGWLNNQNNYIIRLSTEYENTLWQVFSVYRIPTTSDYIQVNFANDDEFYNFITMIKDRSAYNFNTPVQVTDKVLTLSTCYNKTDKVVLHAKLIKRDARN